MERHLMSEDSNTSKPQCATAIVQPTNLPGWNGEWYQAYGKRYDDKDGAEGRLVSMHTFGSSWEMWEMHPKGEEVAVCTQGSLVLHQEHADGTKNTVPLTQGQYAVNPRGTWHSADVVDGEVTCLFITAGLGTEHRPRK